MSEIKIYNSALSLLDTIESVISAGRTEQINGDNTLTFVVPLDTAMTALINNTNVVGTGTDYFDIASYEKSQGSGSIPFARVDCEHVSYRLNNVSYNLDTFTQIGTPTAILTAILSGTGFTVGTVDFTTAMTYSAQEKKSRRQLLMELAYLLEGEVSFNGFQISILNHRGSQTAKDLTAGGNVSVISKKVDKRKLDTLGNPTAYYSCSLVNPMALDLGDVVLLEYSTLDIDISLRIVSLTTNPYSTLQVSFEVSNILPSLESDIYRIETDMIAKNKKYYGARISADTGFESIRNDNMARAVFNADEFKLQTGDGSGSLWVDRIYFDAVAGVYKFDGTLSAAAITAMSLVVGTNVGMGAAIRNFTTTPTTPYEIGDIWTNSTGDIKRCTTTRLTGAYVAGDWGLASNYTSPTGVTSIIDGRITTDYLNAIGISADSISGGTITGVTIDVATDISIGNAVLFTGTQSIDTNGTSGLEINCSGYLELVSGAGVVVQADLLPSVNNAYDLGNSSYRWASLNVGGSVYAAGQIYFPDAYSRVISTRALYINSGGSMGTTSSSKRFKDNIKLFEFDYDALMKLPILEFTYKPEFSDDNDIKHGTTAEDAFDLGLLEFVGKDENGVIDYFAYEKLPIANLQLIQKQNKMIKSLEDRVSTLEKLMAEKL